MLPRAVTRLVEERLDQLTQALRELADVAAVLRPRR
jgi:hypothetical protein